MEIRLEKLDSSQLKTKPDENNLGFGRYFADHMFVMTFDRDRGWHDAVIRKYQDFSLPPAAMVLHYGQAIFEGLKAYRGKDNAIYLFRPTDNLRRMNVSAERMCMPAIPVDEVLAALQTLLRLDADWIPSAKGATLYIRPTMIATEAALGVRPAKQYLFFVILSPVGAYYPEGFNPVKIFVTDKYVRAVPGGVGHVKTAGNYAASIMAAVEAQKQGFTQVLWLDAIERRYIEEVGTMNIFFYLDDELVTPALSGSILPGITRRSILELAKHWGIQAVERAISIDEVVAKAKTGALKEMFGSGTAAIVSPVSEFAYGGQTYRLPAPQPGPLAVRFFETLLGIQYGEAEDTLGWTSRVI